MAPLCNGSCTCNNNNSNISSNSGDSDTDLGPSTPPPTEPVRATHTRFKQYLSRAIEERQMVHQRLMSNPKSAPSRKRQNGWMRCARKDGRAAKFFKQQQEQGDCIALPPLQPREPLPSHRQMIRQAAKKRLQRFARFCKQRLDNIKAWEKFCAGYTRERQAEERFRRWLRFTNTKQWRNNIYSWEEFCTGYTRKRQAEERLRRFVGFLKQRMDNIKALANKICSRLLTYDDGIVFRTRRCYGRMTRHGCMSCDTTCGCGAYKAVRDKYCSAYCKNVAENIC